MMTSRFANTGNGGDMTENAIKRPKLRRTLLRPAIDAFAAFAVFGLVSAAVTSAPSSASPSSAGLGASAFAVSHETVSSLALKAVGDSDDRPVIEIATTSSPANADAIYRRTSADAAWGLLALAFSALAALNLALLRHVRQAYAMPRKPSRSGQ